MYVYVFNPGSFKGNAYSARFSVSFQFHCKYIIIVTSVCPKFISQRISWSVIIVGKYIPSVINLHFSF